MSAYPSCRSSVPRRSPLSFAAAALLTALLALFAANPAPSFAQAKTRTVSALPPMTSTSGASMGLVPLNRMSGLGNQTALPAGITTRKLTGVTGFSANTRVQEGGANGQNVEEQVVDVTQPYKAADDITPTWSADEQYLYYATSADITTTASATSRYRLFRIVANASQYSVSATGTAVTAPTALTDPADTTHDYLFPALNPAGNQIAFLRSDDGVAYSQNPADPGDPQGNPNKVWHLFVAGVPDVNSSSPYIPTAAGATTSSTSVEPLTETITANGLTAKMVNGLAIYSVGRPSWVGANTLVFSARLGSVTAPYHLFEVDVSTGNIVQLTTGNANERNPAVTPDGRLVAFDSDATPNFGPGGTEPYSLTGIAAGPFSQATSVNASGDRNIFVMRLVQTQSVAPAIPAYTVTQFTNKQGTGATDTDNVEPAWSSLNYNQYTNTSSTVLYLAWASTRSSGAPASSTSPHDIYFDQATQDANSNGNTLIGVEGTYAASIAPDTGDASDVYDDRVPTFAPFITMLRVGFQSNRNGSMLEGSFGGGFTLTPGLHDVFTATVIDITAPSLIRYDTSTATGDLVHISQVTDPTHPYRRADDTDYPAVRTRDDGILPGSKLFFAVRVDDRESGIGGVYLQIKNPNSKYQSMAQNNNTPAEYKEYYNAGELSYLNTETNAAGQYQPVLYYSSTAGNFTNPAVAGAVNRGFGPEFEAEAAGVLNSYTTDPTSGVITNDASMTGNYFGHPDALLPGQSPIGGNHILYEAGSDDSVAFAGGLHPALASASDTNQAVWLQLEPLYKRNADGSFLLQNGVPVPETPSDGLGGVLYGASLTVNEASDWYVDVVLYDKAINPFKTSQTSNFIIYDNVWGFSSAAPFSTATQDILFVSDYTLGQKFYGSRFNTNRVTATSNNLLPIDFGAESYYTDVDINMFPAQTNTQTFGEVINTTVNNYNQHGPFQLNIQQTGSPFGVGGQQEITTPNTLGVGSYDDELLTPFSTIVDTKYLPNTGRYSIWRVLSRGPVPVALLNQYLPTTTTAPPDIKAGETANRSVQDVQRMVIWASPFLGDVFRGPGTLLDLSTQNNLTAFVNAGGRLFVSGQDVGFALSSNGSAANSFFNTVLGATLTSDVNGSIQIAPNGANPGRYGNSIQIDPWPSDQHAYGNFNGTNWVYDPPNGSDSYITYNYDGQIGLNSQWKGDGAFTATANGGSNDVVMPGTNALPEYKYSSATAAMISSTYGTGRTVYASFGFESLSNGWYTYTPKNQTYVLLTTYGRRAEIMHNITCSLRTGTLTGRMLDSNGSPVTGALVRAVDAGGNINNAADGTAITDAGGNFTIIGLHPDRYTVYGYKPGYYSQHSANTLMHGASSGSINLLLKNANPGALSGYNNPNSTSNPSTNNGGVFDKNNNPIAGIVVEALLLNPDGSYTVYKATTASDGSYSLPSLPVVADTTGAYIIIANPPNSAPYNNTAYNANYGTVPVTAAASTGFTIGLNSSGQPSVTVNTDNTVPILENTTALINFFLTAAPGYISGHVYDANGYQSGGSSNKPLANVTVQAVLQGTTTVVATGTTGADGAYTLTAVNPTTTDPTALPPGTYVITVASSPGYYTGAPSPVYSVTVTLTTGQHATAPDLVLSALPPGAVSGLVTFTVPGSGAAPSTTGVTGTTIQLFLVTTVNGTSTTATTPSYTAAVSSTPTTDSSGYTYNWRVQDSSGNNFIVAPGTYIVTIVPPSGATATPVQQTVTISPAVETKNVDFTLQPQKVFGAGLQLISLPETVSNIDPRDLFVFTGSNAFNIASYDPSQATSSNPSAGYNIAEYPAGSADTPTWSFVAGQGYFARFGSTAAVLPITSNATTVTGTTTQQTLASAGWHLIGNPFVNETNPSSPVNSILITDPTQFSLSYTTPAGKVETNVSLATAISDGVVQQNIYTYLANSNSYVASTTLAPYYGYWFYTQVPGMTITFGYPGGGRAEGLPIKTNGTYQTITRAELDAPVTRSLTSISLTNWRQQLSVRQGDAADTDNSIGVDTGATNGWNARYDSEKPPIPGSNTHAVSLALQGTGFNGRAAALTDLIQPAGSGTKTWSFTVSTTDSSAGDMTVYWPNVDRLPRGIEPMLVDVETGRHIDMRSGASSYTYATRGKAEHQFQVVVGPPVSLPLDIVSLHSSSTRAAGVNMVKVGFTVTRDSDVTAQVQTLTGRAIRNFSSRAESGAETTVNWDFRDNTGGHVAPGVYVLSISARDSSTGATVRRQVMVMSLQ